MPTNKLADKHSVVSRWAMECSSGRKQGGDTSYTKKMNLEDAIAPHERAHETSRFH